MSTIRPYLPPSAPAQGRGPARAPVEPAPVRAAQRAFFQAALGLAAKDQPGPVPEPRRVKPKPLDRLPRPGSLLDIRV